MTINLRDYSRNAAGRSWGNGWPTNRSGDMATVIATRSGVKFPVNKRVAVLFSLIINEVEGRGYRCVPGWCWGFANRAISGTKTPSNHSWGLAVDINAPKNPYTSSGSHDIPRWVADIFNKYGWAWGGDYSGSKKDWMHFEFMGTPAQADEMTALARAQLAGGPGAPSPAPAPQPPSSGRTTIQKGAKGQLVKDLQSTLNRWYPSLPKLAVDGDFGPGTEARVKYFQTRAGLTADGIVGPKTWGTLGF